MLSHKFLGTHDVAVFDINGDGWNDMILGRCNSLEVLINVPPATPAGSIPDGDRFVGQQLLLEKDADRIGLSWGDSCVWLDDDFAIYEGTLELGFLSHTGRICSTGGANATAFIPQAADSYYLVVPQNRDYEGSYGYDSSGTPRQQGLSVCNNKPLMAGSCE